MRAFLLAALLMAAGCDFLLGPAEAPRGTAGPGWTLTEVTSGAASGLDLGITDGGVIYASYIYEQERVRVSRFEGGTWSHMDGPTAAGTEVPGFTRLGVDPAGGGSVLFSDGAGLQVADFDMSIESPQDLAQVGATVRQGSSSPPTSWTTESSSAAFGPDGVLRVVARSSEQDRLWLFRRSGAGWDVGHVPGSDHVHGSSELLVSAGSTEHVLFAANGQGKYYWWRPSDGWASRLEIPDGQPYVIQVDGVGSSVLATRDRFRVRVAKEEQDPQSGTPYWNVWTVREDEFLFWHTLDLVLDDQGLPGVLYVLGPLPREHFEVWFSRLSGGDFQPSLVAGNLRLPVFNPFDVRMVRDGEGTIHVLLPAGDPDGADGSAHRLIHLRRDPDEGL